MANDSGATHFVSGAVGVMALACLALGAFLAIHYPRGPLGMVAVLALWTGAVWRWPAVWLFALPALLPVIGFAPWTGWLTFEELDILVLGTAAGGYARLALPRANGNIVGGRGRLSIVSLLLITLFGADCVLALYRGLTAEGAPHFGWFQGYNEPLNALRLAKSFLLALSLTPLLRAALHDAEQRAITFLASGLAVGLGAASLGVVWERLAFTDLLDFSSDYRATGLFWEMHVGGAALDGFLALTVPFAVWLFVRSTDWMRLALAAILAALATYACAATFSRGVYLAVPVSLALLALLVTRQGDGQSRRAAVAEVVKRALLAAVAAGAAWAVFRTGGYRTVGAALGVLAVMLLVGPIVRGLARREWVFALSMGALFGALGAVVGPLVYKGVYAQFAMVFAGCMLLIRSYHHGDRVWTGVAALCGFVWLVVAAASVADYWGGHAALRDIVPVLAMMLAVTIWSARAATPLWPESVRFSGAIVGAATLIAGVVAVFGGGAYMTDRFSSAEGDLKGRIAHWRNGLSVLQRPADWLLGRGFGRFPEDYFFIVRDAVFPGSYHLETRDGNSFVALSGPRYQADWGDLFRIAQHVPANAGIYLASFDLRASRDVRVDMHLEICEQHLLYNNACAFPSKPVFVKGDAWQHVSVSMDGRTLNGGSWYAPRLAFFALAVATLGERVDIDNIRVVGPDGHDVIANGNFENGAAHWFIISERWHLPWHIKNLALNVLVDQGAVGLLLFAALVAGALWRLIGGRVRSEPVAPFLAASLVGFLVVGLFDSLLDAPRVAFAFYLLLLLGLILEEKSSRAIPNADPSRAQFPPTRTSYLSHICSSLDCRK